MGGGREDSTALYVGSKPQSRGKWLWRELTPLDTMNYFLRYCSSKNSAM